MSEGCRYGYKVSRAVTTNAGDFSFGMSSRIEVGLEVVPGLKWSVANETVMVFINEVIIEGILGGKVPLGRTQGTDPVIEALLAMLFIGIFVAIPIVILAAFTVCHYDQLRLRLWAEP